MYKKHKNLVSPNIYRPTADRSIFLIGLCASLNVAVVAEKKIFKSLLQNFLLNFKRIYNIQFTTN